MSDSGARDRRPIGELVSTFLSKRRNRAPTPDPRPVAAEVPAATEVPTEAAADERAPSRTTTAVIDQAPAAAAADVDRPDAAPAEPTSDPAPVPLWKQFQAIEPDAEIIEVLARAEALAAAGDVLGAIDLLNERNQVARDRHLEFLLIHLRHDACEQLPILPEPAVWPPVVDDLFELDGGCPVVEAADLTPERLASAVSNHGCLLVRGLIDHDGVDRLVQDIDDAFAASHAKVFARIGSFEGSWYQPFRARAEDPPPALGHRFWVQQVGGVLAADSPPAFFTMADVFEQAGVRDVVGGYLGERPVWSVDKCTLRKVPVDLEFTEWHQDGQFLGQGIRVLNLWLALSPCGGDLPCPGLDFVPKRFDRIVETDEGNAILDWTVGNERVLAEAGDAGILRPEFQPGDALFFDEKLLHRTALDPGMTDERYAIESWFFAYSAYPEGATPVLF